LLGQHNSSVSTDTSHTRRLRKSRPVQWQDWCIHLNLIITIITLKHRFKYKIIYIYIFCFNRGHAFVFDCNSCLWMLAWRWSNKTETFCENKIIIIFIHCCWVLTVTCTRLVLFSTLHRALSKITLIINQQMYLHKITY